MVGTESSSAEAQRKQDYADGYRDGYLSLALLPHPSNIYTQAFLRAVIKGQNL